MNNAKDLAIKVLLDGGYIPDGEVRGEAYAIITSKSYPFAGRLIEPLARIRLALPETNKRATVGPRVVCMYEIVNHAAVNFQNFPTKEFSASCIKGD